MDELKANTVDILYFCSHDMELFLFDIKGCVSQYLYDIKQVQRT